MPDAKLPGVVPTLRVPNDPVDAAEPEMFPANLTNGVSKEEIRAIIHVIGIYCGVPQALECFRVAKKVLEEKNL